MPSFVWGRDPEEAYKNPYEYEAQDQFVREASATLTKLNALLDNYVMHFHRDDLSLEKATWMLSLDLVDSLKESLDLLGEKRHRIAFRLFRDAIETTDLIKVLQAGNAESAKFLSEWYDNETPRHVKLRKHIAENLGEETAKNREEYYKQVSKFTHRTYKALLNTFSLGQDNMLVHDTYSKTGLLVLPHTIASGYAVLANLITEAVEVLSHSCILDAEEVNSAFKSSLESARRLV